MRQSRLVETASSVDPVRAPDMKVLIMKSLELMGSLFLSTSWFTDMSILRPEP